MADKQITAEHIGVWVDGARGKHAPARLIEIALEWGMEMCDPDEEHMLYYGHDPYDCVDNYCSWERIEDLVEKALNHLDLLCSEDVVMVHDMGTVMVLDVHTALREGWIEEE